MRALILLLSVLSFLTACAVAKKTYMPDGRVGYTVDCSGSAMTWASCYEKSGETCGSKGYDILSQGGDQGSIMSAGAYSSFGGSVITRTLIAACKP